MEIRASLLGALDDLLNEDAFVQRQALSTIERLMAQECIDSKQHVESFWNSQNLPEYNVAVRLSLHLAYSLPHVRQALQSSPGSIGVTNDLCQILTILQGVALVHPSSKTYLQRRTSMKAFVELLSVARHISLSHSTEAQGNRPGNTPPSSMPSVQQKGGAACLPPGCPPLASSVLDTLLCVLVDSPSALRTFEECNGLESVVKTLKRAGTDRELRVKCLEFLYFYLLPENRHPHPSSQEEGYFASGPASPSKPRAPADIPLPPSPTKPRAVTLFDRNPLSTQRKSSTKATDLQNPSHKGSIRSDATERGHPNLAILRRDVDFVPLSPKKKQIVKLGIGTPKTTGSGRLRPTSEASDGERSPTKLSVPQLRRSSPLAQNEVSSSKQIFSITPNAFESRKLAASALSDEQGSTGSSPKKTKLIDGSNTHHRPITPTPSSPIKNKRSTTHNETSKGDLIRSTEEKKLLLSTWLGNVDALVEGVQRAGVWGLA